MKIITKDIISERVKEICQTCGFADEVPIKGCCNCRIFIQLENEDRQFNLVVNGNTEEILSITAS